MKTVLKTGPGMFATRTNRTDKSIPENHYNVVCASLEIYQMEKHSKEDDETVWTVLPAMAEGRPDIARAMLDLLSTLERNKAALEQEAKGAR